MHDSDREQIEARLRLLEETHDFPCDFLIKVIGLAQESFIGSVVRSVRQIQQLDEDPPFRVRETPNGKHVAITLEPHVASAEEVLAIYREIQLIPGVVMML